MTPPRTGTAIASGASALSFVFDGRLYEARQGDTLASALLANGVDVVSRSVYRDRPRGVLAAGMEEPNAYVSVRHGEIMVQATRVELRDGLDARAVLRGKAALTDEHDEPRHDKAIMYADVLVVGAGPAGLTAARDAARESGSVVLLDDGPALGGSLLDLPETIDGGPSADWIARMAAELDGEPECRILTRTVALGVYDDGEVVAAEHGATSTEQRLWRIRARRIVLATGAHERPLVFAGNDRPGVMLAGAAAAYANRYGVRAGRRCVVFTTNDSAYRAARDLLAAGVDIEAIVDARPPEAIGEAAIELVPTVPVLPANVVCATTGTDRIDSVTVAGLDGDGGLGPHRTTFACDLLAVSGGFSPSVQLATHTGGRTAYRSDIAGFVAVAPGPIVSLVGAAAGDYALSQCLGDVSAAPALDEPGTFAELWCVPSADGDWEEHFVDLHRDVTVGDVRRAIAAGLTSIEHVKRHTTIGTGPDQGKTSAVNAAGIVADLVGIPIGDVSTSRQRPPYVPVSFSVMAGRRRGQLLDPMRVTPMHPWHVAAGARFEDVGQWKRPWYYPRAGETMDEAVLRECAAARNGVSMMDASTLGKIDIQGPDAAEFLNRVYTNRFDTLAVGMCRYGLMCTADGMVFDDGVAMRLADDRFLTTTTTGGAARVLEWLEEWLQTEWPDLRVHCTSVTEQWATVAVVGPDSRALLATLTDLDLSNDAFPFMAIREATVAGLDARIVRVSFSGELAFEVNVAGWDGLALWEALVAAGGSFDLTPYGTETMHVLRAEKGYVIVGQDTDGTVTPHDLGMDWIVSKVKDDFVGARSLARQDLVREDRLQLVGLRPLDPTALIPEGAQLVTGPEVRAGARSHGHVTSSYRAAVPQHTFALALVRGGATRHGEIVHASAGEATIAAEVVAPVFYDVEGERRDG